MPITKLGVERPVSGQQEHLSYAQLASLPDERLMAYLQQGHSDALAQLFDRYHGLVFGVASRILKDNAETEDLVQAVFLEIFQSAAQDRTGLQILGECGRSE